MPDYVTGLLKRPFDEQVAFFRSKLGNRVPTQRWDDLTRSQHDVAFMVAGAQKADLLSDLAAAVDKAIAEGEGIEAFRKRFDELVERHGWTGWTGEGSPAGRAWRTRIIYKTNMRTSYAAGRLAQLRQSGIKYWMYRHNDTVTHPRPHHKALDGTVLPATDPFWQTYYAPNGWGCRCRIVGVSSPERARALGGNPDKSLPDWVGSTDPKTGAPVGVDPGFDYMPGDTVSDTVRQMAKKTIQWEYTLAKAYMLGLPVTVRDALSTAVRSQPETGEQVRRYVARILEDRKHLDIPTYQTLGLLTRQQSERIKTPGGPETQGFDFALDRSAPLHIFNQHGNVKAEARRGQRAVVAADYARLPEILNTPDVMRLDGQEILYEKIFGNERYVLVFDVIKKRRMVRLKSMRIIIRKRPAAQRP